MSATPTIRDQDESDHAPDGEVRRLRATVARLQAAKQAAEAALDARDEFLATFSHEIRTPITAVLGMVEALGRGELDPEQRRQVDLLHGSARTILALLNDVLDWAKVASGRLELVESDIAVRPLVAEIAALWRPRAADKGVEFTTAIAADVPEAVRGDGIRLRQVLDNLVGNAVKFTATGEIAVEIRRERRAGHRPWLAFRVRDTGIGIAAQAQDRLFDAYTQADASIAATYGGTGLGLAISKRLVERMAGTIELESAEGAGTILTVTLPFTRAAAAGDDPEPAPDPDRVPGGLSILVIDDVAANLEVVRALLGTLGHRVTGAGAARQALELAAKRAYDMILLDLRLPDLPGDQVLRRLRETPGPNRRTPVIAFTAETAESERQACDAQGFDGFIGKPIDIGELIALVRRRGAESA